MKKDKNIKPGRPKIRPECKPINLRLSLTTIANLAIIGLSTGENRTEIIERLVQEEYEKLNK